jgi:hypothetical protein
MSSRESLLGCGGSLWREFSGVVLGLEEDHSVQITADFLCALCVSKFGGVGGS